LVCNILNLDDELERSRARSFSINVLGAYTRKF
jgi:hypothetical protein